MRYVLVAVIAAGISIIQIESKVESLVGVYCEFGIDMVLAVGLIAAIVVKYAGIGRQGVHVQQFVWLLIHKTVGLGKYEVIAIRTVDKDTTQSGGIVASRGVIVAIHATIKSGIHKQVRQGVGLCRNYITKPSVDSPRVEPLRNLLVLCGILAMLVEVLASAAYVSVLVNLIEITISLSADMSQRQ